MEVTMYCTECGQSVIEGLFGELIHEYQQHDEHIPHVEEIYV